MGTAFGAARAGPTLWDCVGSARSVTSKEPRQAKGSSSATGRAAAPDLLLHLRLPPPTLPSFLPTFLPSFLPSFLPATVAHLRRSSPRSLPPTRAPGHLCTAAPHLSPYRGKQSVAGTFQGAYRAANCYCLRKPLSSVKTKALARLSRRRF
jgi:hypothetical protein